jgi:putative transmembrane protein PGPGW
MLESLRKQWRAFRADPPGERFQLRHERRRKARRTLAVRLAWIGFAVFLVGVGIVLVPAPGPGFLVILFGAALLAEESLLVARGLDRAEVWVRSLFGKPPVRAAKRRRT